MPHRGTSNEYPQHMFPWKIKRKINIFGLKIMPYLEVCLKLKFRNTDNRSYPKCLGYPNISSNSFDYPIMSMNSAD